MTASEWVGDGLVGAIYFACFCCALAMFAIGHLNNRLDREARARRAAEPWVPAYVIEETP